MVCFGKPASVEKKGAWQLRYDPKFILHENRYQRLMSSEVEEMEKPLSGGLLSIGQIPCWIGEYGPAQLQPQVLG